MHNPKRSIAAISAAAALSAGGAQLGSEALAAAVIPVDQAAATAAKTAGAANASAAGKGKAVRVDASKLNGDSKRLGRKSNPADLGKTSKLISNLGRKAFTPKRVHPVAGSVDYGDVIAAFGHARGRPHQGQDIFAPAGTALVAPSSVVVVEAGSDGGRGNWIALYDKAEDVTYSYFHLLGPTNRKPGQQLSAGQKVGEVGCTGSCWGDHLHFEIRSGKGPYGEAHDPMPWLKDATSIKPGQVRS